MALHIWALMAGVVHLAAGRLSAARANIELLPTPEQPGSTFVNAMRMFTLAEVAARTDDRTLLVETMSEASDAYSNGSPAVRRGAACVLGLAAWQRDDVHEAVRWLGSDIALLMTPLLPTVLDQLTLTARVGVSRRRCRPASASIGRPARARTRAARGSIVRHRRPTHPRDTRARCGCVGGGGERASRFVTSASLCTRCRGRGQRAGTASPTPNSPSCI
jgi:hypothetical protein